MKFQYISNLNSNIEAHADFLIISGNALYHKVKRACRQFLIVIWIFGNMDYWGHNPFDPAFRNHKIPNLVILEKEYFDIGDTRIYGATFWNHIPIDSIQYVQERSVDCKKIQEWTVITHLAERFKTIAWLNQVQKMDKRQIVVSFYIPPDEILNILRDKIDTWVIGNSPTAVDYIDNGIRIVANPNIEILPDDYEKIIEKFLI